ncbi:microtubule-associated protein tau isoform X2 [Leptinotarsa decemlineata]|uniref:microtubule-associated protein tau isoform X2 n=1 Tax=Leptinotarsa decemlineata TaxID=7539 RepID=UPI003D305DF4
MSEQPNSLINGPSTDYSKDMPKLQNGNGPQSLPPQYEGPPINPQRPLTRVDSRSNFQFRPPFPNQPGTPIRPGPGQVRQSLPPGSQQFLQRNPNAVPIQRLQGSIQGPQGISQGPAPGFQGISQGPPGQPFPANQQRAGFRPQTPFPRQAFPNQRPPGIFQQRSVPSFGNLRPQIQEELGRSQTLDTSETDHSNIPNDNKINSNDYIKAPSIAAMNNRSFSLSSNPPEPTGETREEARRRSVSSVDSMGEGRPGSRPLSRQSSVSGSNENLDKKPDNEIPSRPESRSTSRMNKIIEDEDLSTNSLTEISQKSPDLSNISPSTSNSPSQPTVSKTPDSAGNQPVAREPLENGTKDGPSGTGKYLDLGKPPKPKSPARSEGDNDSGVDESTQGNDKSSNSENRSPRKSSKSRTPSSTPVARSLSRGSKSPSLKSPDSNVTTPGSATEKKKISMNKIQVGSAPSPNLKVVKSKIGSLENASYKPGGGKVKIESKKLDFKSAAPRIEAKNEKYTPKGGEKKIVQQKLQWSAKSKIGSLENTTHKPKGGDKKIETVKLDFKGKAKPKVGSKDNIKHVPGGGDIKIETKKIDLKVTSKVGSLDNVKYKPGGGDKKIFDDKEYLKQMSAISSVEHSLSGSQDAEYIYTYY